MDHLSRINLGQGRKYYLLSPHLAQSITLFRLLRRAYPDAPVRGLPWPNGLPSEGRSWADQDRIPLSSDTLPTDGIVVPTGGSSTEKLLSEWGEVKLGEYVLTKSVLRVTDKLDSLSRCEALGIPVPQSWNRLPPNAAFPLFVKSAFESRNKVRQTLNGAKDYADLPVGEELLFQEKIEGPGTFGVAFLARSGVLDVHCCHWEKHSYPREGGSAVLIEKFHDGRLLDYTARLVKDLGYSGWGLAEFKYCPARKDYVFMEINAKLWASLAFTFACEPRFGEALFGLPAPRRRCSSMLFVDRMLMSGLPTIARVLPRMLAAKCLWLEPARAVMKQWIPAPVKAHWPTHECRIPA